MARAPFQVLVIPFRPAGDGSFHYALFKRDQATGGYWQWIAGGGEDDESPLEAACREANEEADIRDGRFIALDSRTMIPVVNVTGFLWGDDTLVIPEYCFGVEVAGAELVLSGEHAEYRWSTYDEAEQTLRWDSNLRRGARVGPTTLAPLRAFLAKSAFADFQDCPPSRG